VPSKVLAVTTTPRPLLGLMVKPSRTRVSPASTMTASSPDAGARTVEPEPSTDRIDRLFPAGAIASAYVPASTTRESPSAAASMASASVV
jgi:hypothetical protein